MRWGINRLVARPYGRVARLARQRGPHHAPHPDLVLNLSHVLHERSDSLAVHAIAQRCRLHSEFARSVDRTDRLPIIRIGNLPEESVDVITATVGLPEHLHDMLRQAIGGNLLSFICIDGVGHATESPFFRSPARLILPEGERRVIVAAAIARPGGRATQLCISPAMTWPTQRADILGEVEGIIRDYVDQWVPPRALWSAPVEVTLADEVM